MRRQIRMRWLLAMALGLALLCAVSMAFAEQGQLTVTVGNDESQYERGDIRISLYQIGTMNDQYVWSINSLFNGINILNAEATWQIDAAANAISDILQYGFYSVDISGTTDDNGTVVFGSLDPGIYFGEMESGPAGLSMQSFLISVPYFENNAYQYAVRVLPKMTYTPPQPPTQNTATPPPEEQVPPEEEGNHPPRNPYNLTVYYIYEDGSTAWPTHYETGLWPGTPYDVVSPVIPGYVATIQRVSGTMPYHNVEYTVIYVPRDSARRLIDLDEYETPLGLGEIQIHVGVCYE